MVRTRGPAAILVAAVALAAVVLVAIVARPPSTPVPTGPAAAEIPPPKTAIGPGRYTNSDFHPRVTFEIATNDWATRAWGQGYFEIWRLANPNDFNGLRIAFIQPVEVVSVGMEGVRPQSAADAAQKLGYHDIATIVGTDTWQVGAMTGVVDLMEHTPNSDMGLPMLEIPALPDEAVYLNPGGRLWAAFFETGSGVLAIAVVGWTETWDADFAAVKPVLDTVTIEP